MLNKISRKLNNYKEFLKNVESIIEMFNFIYEAQKMIFN